MTVTGIATAQAPGPRDYCAPISTTPVGDSAADAIPLGEGQALEAIQGAGDTVAYAFAATAGQSYLVEVAQRGLDLTLTVQFPDGSRRAFNSPLGRDEREIVLLEGVQAGTHTIILRSAEHTAARGGHTTRVLSVASGGDQRERAFQRLVTSAAEWNEIGGEEHWTRARATYTAAAELAGDDERSRAYALYAATMLSYWRLSDSRSAVRLSEQVAASYRALNEPMLAANATHLLGAALINTAAESADPNAAYSRALGLFDEAAAVQTRFGRLYELAHTLNDLGVTHYYLGNWDRARDYWQQAATMFSSLDEMAGQLLPMANIGAIEFEEGHLTNAVDSYERVLALQAPGKDLQRRSDFLSNLASVQRILGNLDAALRNFSCARTIAEDVDYAWGIGWALAGIGETYYSIGEFDLAERYLRDALPKEREAGDTRGVAVVLRHLGNIEHMKGAYEVALELHREALAITTPPPERALAQLDVARDLSALAKHDEAISLVQDSLAIAEPTRSRSLIADVNQALGRAHLAAGLPEAALHSFEASLAAYDALGMEVEQARTLNGLALAARDLDQIDAAARYGEASLQYVEKIRGRVADPELRAFYLSARRDYVELQVDLLQQLHRRHPDGDYVAASLTTSERSRARQTLDLIQDRGIDIDQSDPGDEHRRSDLYRQLAERRYQRDALAKSSTSDIERSSSYRDVLSALAAIENELNLLETNERGARTMAVSEPLGAREMQAAIGGDAVLIQYALGSIRSYVWVVTQEALEVVELGDSAAIEAAARAVFEDLETVGGAPTANAARARRERLADLVLAPIKDLLGKHLILVAADGALQYVPFASLPLRGVDGPPRLLVDEHEIVYVPSVSVVVRERESSRRRAPSKEVAVFADPVFEASDPRLAPASNAASVRPDPSDLPTLANLRASVPLDRLSSTAEEARQISTLVPEDRRLVALGFEASRDRVLAADLSDYRIIHLATHGIIDTRYPDLSALVFSRFDASGERLNGFLELHDVLELDLNADLVVLSACETALGRDVKAEGLLGLTQGFMHAGTRSLVVALWSVSDRATAELMKAFYTYMLDERMRPAEALRRAQISVAAQPRWRDPYYWAAFTVVGDWS